jgi:cytochrome c-type biogenesis protein
MGGRVTNTVAAQTMSGTVTLVKPTFVSRVSTVLHGAAFVGGFTFVFVALGLLANMVIRQVIGGQNIALVLELIGRVGGLLIIFFGLHFMGVVPSILRWLLSREHILASPLFAAGFAFVAGSMILWAFVDWLIGAPVLLLFLLWLTLGGGFTQPARFWTRNAQALLNALYADTRRQMVASGQQSFSSSALMGVVFAAGWTPCIGPIYGSILTMSATGNDTGQAAILLIAYSLGLGIPFLLCALLLDSAQSILRKMQRHLHKIELVTGAFLVLIGVFVATGNLQRLSQNFANRFADFSIQLEQCVIGVTEGEIGLGDLPNCINAQETPVPVSSSMESESLLEDDIAFKNNLHLGMTSQISPQW